MSNKSTSTFKLWIVTFFSLCVVGVEPEPYGSRGAPRPPRVTFLARRPIADDVPASVADIFPIALALALTVDAPDIVACEPISSVLRVASTSLVDAMLEVTFAVALIFGVSVAVPDKLAVMLPMALALAVTVAEPETVAVGNAPATALPVAVAQPVIDVDTLALAVSLAVTVAAPEMLADV